MRCVCGFDRFDGGLAGARARDDAARPPRHRAAGASESFIAKPGALVDALLRCACRMERGHHFQVIFGNEAADGQFALHHHGQRGRLHAAHRKILVIRQRVGAREVHAHQPVGAAAPAGGIGQGIVIAAGPERIEPSADGVRRERRDPQAAHGLRALRRFVDVAEDQLAFAARVGGAHHLRNARRIAECAARFRTGLWSSRRPPAASVWAAWAAGRAATAATRD